jgi:hypothetical protein
MKRGFDYFRIKSRLRLFAHAGGGKQKTLGFKSGVHQNTLFNPDPGI